ncbi:hypothetical protein CFAM422_000783 [Trichoderma lentiforme]|uniref:Uncharacterized protein n=1 Tax=Trichoderma lentiforme TaxID=1567552 RepID=A0A9P5CIM4_9HYPO|nr:hypothetical protein CFAM422_000783 [Trichoderma lentiforme]
MTLRHTLGWAVRGNTALVPWSKQEDRAPSESQKAAPRKKKPVLPGLARTGRALAGRLKWTGWLSLALARETPFTHAKCLRVLPSRHNPPLGTGAHRPSFPVGQPAGSPGGV